MHRWARQRAEMFLDPDAAQQAMVGQMVAQFPGWIDPQTARPVGDPFVIALARAAGGTPRFVVSHEVLGGPGATKIPNVCQQYGIEHLRLPDLFVRESWRF